MLYNKNDILGFETDTVWGIGCHPLNPVSVQKIYNIKGRNKNKPLILMSNNLTNILPFIKEIPDYAQNLINKYFPGALTLILNKTDFCPDYITSNMSTIGIRIPNHKGFYAIAEKFEGNVLATTSLNLSDMPPVKNYNEAMLKFGNEIKIIKPEAESEHPEGKASTVVLCTQNSPVVLRQGSVNIF